MRAVTDLGLDEDGATLLLLGAHPDDVEIGAGGTVLQLIAHNPALRVVWFIGSATAQREGEARRSAADFVPPDRLELIIADHPDGFFPETWGAVKRSMTDLRRLVPDPRLILAPRAGDAHQDHALLGGLVRQVWRDHLIAAYEIPKFESESSTTNVLVALDSHHALAKVEKLMGHHQSQHDKPWYDAENFRAQLRLAGIQAHAQWAEAFSVDKMVWR